jgi:hypothetical protein
MGNKQPSPPKIARRKLVQLNNAECLVILWRRLATDWKLCEATSPAGIRSE